MKAGKMQRADVNFIEDPDQQDKKTLFALERDPRGQTRFQSKRGGIINDRGGNKAEQQKPPLALFHRREQRRGHHREIQQIGNDHKREKGDSSIPRGLGRPPAQAEIFHGPAKQKIAGDLKREKPPIPKINPPEGRGAKSEKAGGKNPRAIPAGRFCLLIFAAAAHAKPAFPRLLSETAVLTRETKDFV